MAKKGRKVVCRSQEEANLIVQKAVREAKERGIKRAVANEVETGVEANGTEIGAGVNGTEAVGGEGGARAKRTYRKRKG